MVVRAPSTRSARPCRSIGADLEIWDTMRTGQYARRLPRRRRVLYADDLFSRRYARPCWTPIRDRPDAHSAPRWASSATLLPGVARTLAAHPMIYRPSAAASSNA